MYGFVKTAIHYFKEAAKNKSVSEMLRRSLPSIQEFLRNWSDLTDQLLRIDDLVFHGFGNNSALSMTLPECALDFYHMKTSVKAFKTVRKAYNAVKKHICACLMIFLYAQLTTYKI